MGKARAKPFKVVGRPIARIEGPEKVSGKSRYAADQILPGMVWGKCLRSPLPHARIGRIDTSKVKRLRGVLAVLTAEDLPPVRVGLRLRDLPLLATGKTRFVGERVAVVAAEEREVAEEALSLINVEYEELPALFDPLDAMEPGAPALHEELASYQGLSRPAIERPNFFSFQTWSAGNLEEGFRQADLTIEHTFQTQLSHQGYIEPHAAVVSVDGSGKIDVWASCKAPFRLKEHLASQVGLSEELIRVHLSAVGGDFGGKSSMMDVPLAYFLSRATGRPVKMAMSYAEELAAANPRHPSLIRLKSGVKKDGALVAREAEVVFNSGAYAAFKPTQNLGGAAYATGVYRIPNYTIRSYGVYTNSVPCGFYRAPGQPQAIFAVESHTDLIARDLGMDPLEFRLKNLVCDGDMVPPGRSLERIRCREILEAAAKTAGWARPKTRAGIGRGIAVAFRPVGIWGGDSTTVEISVSPKGEVTVMSAVPDTGAGIHTLLRQITAEVLTIPPENVQVVVGDTESFEADAEPGGSKITVMTGQAALAAAEELREKMKAVAASRMGIAVEAVQLRGGSFSGKGRRVSFKEVARRATEEGRDLRVRKIHHPKESSPVASFFAQVAEVEVDPETGRLKVRRLVSAHDVGTIINPLAHQGQIEGGAVQGVGYATMEELVREDGRVLSMNLGEFRIPCVQDIPELKTVLIEDRAGPGPFAAKHIGENGIVPTAAAIANALQDAVGVRLFDLPLTGEKIYDALRGR